MVDLVHHDTPKQPQARINHQNPHANPAKRTTVPDSGCELPPDRRSRQILTITKHAGALFSARYGHNQGGAGNARLRHDKAKPVRVRYPATCLSLVTSLLPCGHGTRWCGEWLGELHTLPARRNRVSFAKIHRARHPAAAAQDRKQRFLHPRGRRERPARGSARPQRCLEDRRCYCGGWGGNWAVAPPSTRPASKASRVRSARRRQPLLSRMRSRCEWTVRTLMYS